MPTPTPKLDLAQRIAEHVARTSEPRAPIAALGVGDDTPNQERIGTVPMHLRHLHNLLEDLANDAHAAAREYQERKALLGAVRALFFASLETHIPRPESEGYIIIRQDWSVVANMENDSGSDLAGMLAAALGGALRR